MRMILYSSYVAKVERVCKTNILSLGLLYEKIS